MRISFTTVAATCLLAGTAAGQPPERYNVRDFGAVGDGVTDDTAAFQSALTAAGDVGGGIVFAPRGDYLIASHLAVPDTVTLEGVFTVPTAWTQRKGTTLLAIAGEGSEDGSPFISLGANSVLKGLTVFYPNQNDPLNIKPFPWCIQGRGGDNSSVVDTLLVNPYNGVDFGTHPCGRHYIRNLYGQPLRRGIFIDQCYDVGRIENVHFWPFWHWAETGFQQWLSANGEAMIFGRTDWEYVLNPFVFGYRIGYRFIETAHGACNGNLLGLGADASGTAVWVDQCQAMGLLISNGEFVAMMGPEPIAVYIGPECTGNVNLANCAFWGPSRQLLRQEGTGTTLLQNCNFLGWDSAGEGRPALEARSGQLVVSGCDFTKRGHHVSLGEDVLAATIFGNRVAGTLQVTNTSAGAVEIGLNAQASVTRGFVELGTRNRSRFVAQWDGEDCRTNPVDVAGVAARTTLGKYMLFGVDDALAGGGSHPRLRVEVEYRDQGAGIFFVEYDSSDAAVAIVPQWPGAFKASTERITLQDTGEWRTAIFDLPDALFANRCNGGDFRVTAPAGPVTIRRVAVSHLP
jgi:hypothetical protein